MKQLDWYNIAEYAIARTKNIVVILNKDMKVEWVNDSFSKNLFYFLDEVKGQSIHFLFNGDYPFERYQTQEKELQWKDKRGYEIWFQVNQFCTYQSNQPYTVLIANPITKWKNLEALNSEQHLLIEAFSNSFSEINIVLGHQYQIMAFNHFASHFFRRYLKVELQKGYNFSSIMPDWMKPYMTRQLNRAFEAKRIKKKTYIRNFKKYFNLGFFPITKEENKVMAVSFHAEDITNQERYLKRLRKQKNQIQKLAWNNSHALRRPVANIVGLSDILHNDQSFGGEPGYLVKKILESSIDLDRKIKQLSKDLEKF